MQKPLQGAAVGGLNQHLGALDIGHALHGHGNGRVEKHIVQMRQLALVGGIGGGTQKGLGGVLGFGIGSHQCLEGKGWHCGVLAFTQLLLGKTGVVVLAQGLVDHVLRLKALYPHLGVAALCADVAGVAPGAACGLHQQAKQALGRAKVAAEQRAVGLYGGHQGDAAKVMAFGHHLRADQHIDLSAVHQRQLLFKRAFVLGGVGINTANACGPAVGALHIAQQAFQLFFELLRALAQRQDVGVAACGAGVGHAARVAAVVTAQGAVAFVKDLVGAAVRAVTFPVAVGAKQYGRKSPAVKQNQALLAFLNAFGNSGQQRRRKHRLLGLRIGNSTA